MGEMMNGRGRVVIAVVGRKGGAGKTTTAFNLAGALAEKGYAVRLVDLDPQSSLARLAPNEGVLDYGAMAEKHAGRGNVAGWLAEALPDEGYIVIDTPPHLGAIMDAAIAVADRVVLPTRLAQQDIDSLLDTLNRCPDGALIVPNAVSSRYRIHRDMVTELRRVYGPAVSSYEIPESVVVQEALNASQPVVRYRRRSAPAVAYRALVAEVAP